MKRWGLTVVLILAALLGLAIAFAGSCSEGFNRPQTLGAIAAGCCLGGVVGIALSGRVGRPRAAGLVVAIVVSFGLYVLVVLNWAGECSN